MAIRKSELYSKLWASCDELRGGMDASQYKDYVLVLLFIKYISDKYAGQPYAPLVIPEGASFAAMVALKGKAEIGDRINKEIIAPLVKANDQLSQSDFPDFNDQAKLGSGKELVDRLTNLIAIFEAPSLNFSRNRADDDDILGDAYEFLMRHFAIESGKSKGQFLTPSEVSRVKAEVLTSHAVKQGAAVVVPAKTLVLVTRSGILRKHLPVARIDKPMAINQDIKALIPHEGFCSEFLLHALTCAGNEILSSCMKSGTTVESVEFSWLKTFVLPIPLLEEQEAIASVLSDMDAEISALDAQRDRTRALKQAMMQELLTGRIRLV